MSVAAAIINREDKKLGLTPKHSITSTSFASVSSSAETLHPRSALPLGSSTSSLGFNASNHHQRPTADAKSAKELPTLSKTFSNVPISKSYPPMIRNQLAEQNDKPLNQTFTFGSRLISTSSSQQLKRGRSSSIDSDFGDYTIHGALTGIFPRSIGSGIKSSLSNHIGRKAFSQSSQPRLLPHNLTTLWAQCAKLPSLDDCSPNRKCCQKQFASTRTQFELAKYKNAFKNN